MKGMTVLSALLGLALLWALTRPLAADLAYATEHQLRLAGDARNIALMATLVTLRPTPKPCGPPVAGRC